ncbi:hypothetical protein B0H13DRAFT_2578194 [Mycena leptocephala]|nr:hypothetical protein B0H13DRAFT_2578194 [Mycena leptocephala]
MYTAPLSAECGCPSHFEINPQRSPRRPRTWVWLVALAGMRRGLATKEASHPSTTDMIINPDAADWGRADSAGDPIGSRTSARARMRRRHEGTCKGQRRKTNWTTASNEARRRLWDGRGVGTTSASARYPDTMQGAGSSDENINGPRWHICGTRSPTSKREYVQKMDTRSLANVPLAEFSGIGPVKLLQRVVPKIPQIWPKKAYVGADLRPKKA